MHPYQCIHGVCIQTSLWLAWVVHSVQLTSVPVCTRINFHGGSLNVEMHPGFRTLKYMNTRKLWGDTHRRHRELIIACSERVGLLDSNVKVAMHHLFGQVICSLCALLTFSIWITRNHWKPPHIWPQCLQKEGFKKYYTTKNETKLTLELTLHLGSKSLRPEETTVNI